MKITITKNKYTGWDWELSRPGKCTLAGTARTKGLAQEAALFEQRMEEPRFAEKVANQWESQREARENVLLALNVY
jgi:hypothetical protein